MNVCADGIQETGTNRWCNIYTWCWKCVTKIPFAYWISDRYLKSELSKYIFLLLAPRHVVVMFLSFFPFNFDTAIFQFPREREEKSIEQKRFQYLWEFQLHLIFNMLGYCIRFDDISWWQPIKIRIYRLNTLNDTRHLCVWKRERERESGKKEFLSNGVKLKSTLYKVWLKCLSFHSLDVKYAVV